MKRNGYELCEMGRFGCGGKAAGTWTFVKDESRTIALKVCNRHRSLYTRKGHWTKPGLGFREEVNNGQANAN